MKHKLLDIPKDRGPVNVMRNIILIAAAMVMFLLAYSEMTKLAVVATAV